ncbi:hypothetical protein SynRS9902_00216 [Synechococcus sp. RS9902]|nr:hypothetical protein SynRS9902_00216 [Synechococcus sp. RS9902]
MQEKYKPKGEEADRKDQKKIKSRPIETIKSDVLNSRGARISRITILEKARP